MMYNLFFDLIKSAIAFVLVSLTLNSALAENQVTAAQYKSAIDESLTIRKLSVLPVIDNVQGIYARPIEQELVRLVSDSHHWDFVTSDVMGQVQTPEELDINQSQVQALCQQMGVDGIVVARASKGPNGVSMRVAIFGRDGMLIAHEQIQDHARFEISDLKNQIKDMYGRMIKRLPYDGLILSRFGKKVTLNLGAQDGIKVGDHITAIHITKVNRHPKFNFIVSSEKELIGKIKIMKVDKTLSFGSIISEKEIDVIQKFAKLASTEMVNYPEPLSLGDASPSVSAMDEPAQKMIYGENPQEWVPRKPPTFGRVGFQIGLGSFTSNVSLEGETPLNTKTGVYPSMGILGEMWINPEWLVRAQLQQGVISMQNPLSGSIPQTLSIGVSSQSLLFGYNFLLNDYFFGPKFTVLMGYSSHAAVVTDSAPTALTSTSYGGLHLAAEASLPISDDGKYTAGARYDLILNAKLLETPVTTGATARNNVNRFALLTSYKWREHILISGSLDFEFYSSQFDGMGTRGAVGQSINETYSTFSGGVNYLF